MDPERSLLNSQAPPPLPHTCQYPWPDQFSPRTPSFFFLRSIFVPFSQQPWLLVVARKEIQRSFYKELAQMYY